MTPSQFLEVLVSVSLQATIYVVLCRFLATCASSDETRCRVWMNCQFGLVLLVLIAGSLPHLRFLPGKELSDPKAILTAAIAQQYVGTTLFVIWVAGALVSGMMVLLSGAQMLLFLRKLEELSPVHLEKVEHLLKSFPAGQVRIAISNLLTSPFCWQFQKPVVVLPQQFLDLSSQELELILKHELAHLAANHPLHLFIQRIVQCIYWFHPAVYWAGRQTDIARELMCDAAAAGERKEITAYLQVLLKVIEQARAKAPNRLGLAFLFSRDLSVIARRARRLAERAQTSTSPVPARAWLPMVSVLIVGLVTTAWIPVNVLSSHRSRWSACPAWTAEIFHDLGLPTRDYEVYEGRLQVFDVDPTQPASHD